MSESVFTLSNGHIGVRGNLDENDPAALPGHLPRLVYETRPLPYAESGYGYPESGQTVVNLTDGKLIRCSSTTIRSTFVTARSFRTSGFST